LIRAAAATAIVASFGWPIASSAVTAELKAGWTAGLDVTLEGAAGLRGGTRVDQTLHGLTLATLEWEQAENADRAVHFHAYASAMTLAGRGPTARFVGDFLSVSNIEGFSSTRLYSWWLEAQRGDWSLRAGALLADEEFTGTGTGGNFFNAAFGWPVFISANTVNTGPAFFVAAPGVRLERTCGETAAWRLGVYDGDTFDSAAGDPAITRHGLHYRVGGDQGWFAISEVTFAPADSGARYKAGAWLHTAKFADVRDDATGQRRADTGGEPLSHARNYGAYAAIERTLAGKPGDAGYMAAHLRGGVSPADRNMIAWSFDTGFAFTGLLPCRPADITALGFVQANFSPRFAANARAIDPAGAAPDFEQVVELSHRVALSERFSLQPDLQFIRHPGGSAASRDALAFLVRLTASY
jgi:porin